MLELIGVRLPCTSPFSRACALRSPRYGASLSGTCRTQRRKPHASGVVNDLLVRRTRTPEARHRRLEGNEFGCGASQSLSCG